MALAVSKVTPACSVWQAKTVGIYRSRRIGAAAGRLHAACNSN
jgi:hypothetical protein